MIGKIIATVVFLTLGAACLAMVLDIDRSNTMYNLRRAHCIEIGAAAVAGNYCIQGDGTWTVVPEYLKHP